jgi:nitroimidazol reductase NimA-like FMN-containing flavoprotein (pyridoxamine 5'-phosphate oxidase superfamily)
MRRTDREVTDLTEIEEIIKQCRTCHVAMADENGPYLVPLSFGYRLKGRELSLYFHSAKEGRKLDIWRKNSRVCFEMCYEGEAVRAETPCDSGYYYASLIGNGDIRFIDDLEEKCEALSLLMEQQAGLSVRFDGKQAKDVCVFKICTTDYCGKQKPKLTL